MCLLAGTENWVGFRLRTNGLTVRTQSQRTECWRLPRAACARTHGPSVFVVSGFPRVEAAGGALGDSGCYA